MFLGLSSGLCQKTVRKAMLLPHVNTVLIDAERFSRIELETVPGAELHLEAVMEGEYQRDIGIEITEEGNILSIAGAFQPFFEVPNDKLSAHKVVAVSLFVRVPEEQEVLIYGTSTRVDTRGAYRKLEIVLSDGQCFLEEPEGQVSVMTQSGNIQLRANSGKLTAVTRYGRVVQEEIPQGRNEYNLESIKGNIYVERHK